MVLMAICDANLKFIYASVGAMGSNPDSMIFRETTFYKMMEEERLNLPSPATVRGSQQVFPYTFVADAAFPLKTNLMTPYSRRGQLTDEEARYNKELSRARISIENAFGVLASRWRILDKRNEMEPKSCDKVILACVALHNFIISRGGRQYIPDSFIDRENHDGQIISGDYHAILQTQQSLIGNQSTSRSSPTIAAQQKEMIKQFLNAIR